jgi:hypothetical protein
MGMCPRTGTARSKANPHATAPAVQPDARDRPLALPGGRARLLRGVVGGSAGVVAFRYFRRQRPGPCARLRLRSKMPREFLLLRASPSESCRAGSTTCPGAGPGRSWSVRRLRAVQRPPHSLRDVAHVRPPVSHLAGGGPSTLQPSDPPCSLVTSSRIADSSSFSIEQAPRAMILP